MFDEFSEAALLFPHSIVGSSIVILAPHVGTQQCYGKEAPTNPRCTKVFTQLSASV